MLKEEMEVMELGKRLEKLSKNVDLYEDVKYTALVNQMRTQAICFTVIITAMILGFFIWLSIPEKEMIETETTEFIKENVIEQDSSGGGTNYFNGNEVDFNGNSEN